MIDITSRMIKVGSYQSPTAQTICVLNIIRTVIQLGAGQLEFGQKTHIFFCKLSLKLKKTKLTEWLKVKSFRYQPA